ncbi:hypothetical protein D3C78_1898490 [compost metagenome]
MNKKEPSVSPFNMFFLKEGNLTNRQNIVYEVFDNSTNIGANYLLKGDFGC